MKTHRYAIQLGLVLTIAVSPGALHAQERSKSLPNFDIRQTNRTKSPQLDTTREAADDMPATLVGPVDSIIDRIQRHRDKYDISYRIVPFYAMEAFAPVIAKLSGS